MTFLVIKLMFGDVYFCRHATAQKQLKDEEYISEDEINRVRSPLKWNS